MDYILVDANGNTAVDFGTDYVRILNSAEKQYIRKTQPTLATQDLGTTTLINGEQTIYKVQVSADAKGDVDVASITFDVSVKLN